MQRITITLLALAWSAGVAAQTAAPAPPAPAASQEAGGIKYLNGGAGEEERKQMQAQSAQYPLQITFSGRGGEYAVADTVTVSNRQGPLLTIANAGPIVMLNLPPGAYAVKANFGNLQQERAISTSTGPQKLNWSMPGS